VGGTVQEGGGKSPLRKGGSRLEESADRGKENLQLRVEEGRGGRRTRAYLEELEGAKKIVKEKVFHCK